MSCRVLLFCLCLIGSSLGSQAAESLRISFGNALPPWVIPDAGRGILVDILKETLESEGYKILPQYDPYARRIFSFRSGKVDITIDMNQQVIAREKLEGYLSDIVYAYENYAYSLKDNGFKFTRISDLRQHSVLAWQGAKYVLGAEYAEMVAANPTYSEHSNQELQIKMLFAKRLDVIQLDKEIFKYFRKKVGAEGKINTQQAVDSFALFGQNRCGFIFQDRAVRDIFNQRFAELQSVGRIAEIYERYVGSSDFSR